MPNSFEVQICDAIVAELNDSSRSWQTPTAQFTASREWARVYTGSELQTLQVKAVPLTIPTEQTLARSTIEKFEYEIALDFQQIVTVNTDGVPDKTSIDTLSKLAQDVHDFYRDCHTLTGITPTPIVMDALRPTIFDEALLYNQNTFETTIFLTVRMHR